MLAFTSHYYFWVRKSQGITAFRFPSPSAVPAWFWTRHPPKSPQFPAVGLSPEMDLGIEVVKRYQDPSWWWFNVIPYMIPGFYMGFLIIGIIVIGFLRDFQPSTDNRVQSPCSCSIALHLVWKIVIPCSLPSTTQGFAKWIPVVDGYVKPLPYSKTTMYFWRWRYVTNFTAGRLSSTKKFNQNANQRGFVLKLLSQKNVMKM